MSICFYDRGGLLRKVEVWGEMSADSVGNEDNPRKEELEVMSIDCIHNRENEVIGEALEEISIC
jgi:hypothetical protein